MFHDYKTLFFKIKPDYKIKNELSTKLSILKQAKSEQKFNYDRVQEMIKGVEKTKTTVLWQESIIKSLEEENAKRIKKNELESLKRGKELELKKQQMKIVNRILVYFRNRLLNLDFKEKESLLEEYRQYFKEGLFDKEKEDDKRKRQRALELEEEIRQLGERYERQEWQEEIEEDVKENQMNYHNMTATNKILSFKHTNTKTNKDGYKLSANYYRFEIDRYKQKIEELENKLALKHKNQLI